MTATERRLWAKAWLLIAEIDALTLSGENDARRIAANEELAVINRQITVVRKLKVVR